MEAIRDGFLRTTPGDRVSYQQIGEEILAICRRFAVQEILGDPLFQGAWLFEFLQDQAAEMMDFPQTITHFARPTRVLEETVTAEQLRHGNNPLLRWQASNVVVYRDNNDNMRPDKKRSSERIDEVVALIMALAAVARVDTECLPGVISF